MTIRHSTNKSESPDNFPAGNQTMFLATRTDLMAKISPKREKSQRTSKIAKSRPIFPAFQKKPELF
ncbi:MAG: hypothetical protein HQL72_06710 [Magnetococcales bacterium]|nr:hypothetical protein [Magnetococcales bacterium]